MRKLLTISLMLVIPLFGVGAIQCSSPITYIHDAGANRVDLGAADKVGTSDDDWNSVGLDKKEKIQGWFQDFNFNIPAGSTIDGFEITIEGYFDYGDGDCKNAKVELWSDPDKGTKYDDCGYMGDGSDITTTFGGPTDLMKFTGLGGPDKRLLFPADINDVTFGLKVKYESDVDGNKIYFDFIQICVYYTEATLPIELIEFTVKEDNNYVLVEWTTVTESNNNKFIVEKSHNGENFEFVGEVAGSGNSNHEIHYKMIDINPYLGYSHYRLTQIDFDGVYEVFNVVTIYIKNNVEKYIAIYPNPTHKINKVNIKFNGFYGDEILIIVMDIFGRTHYSKLIITNNIGETIHSIDPYNRISYGTYLIIGSTNDYYYFKKLIIE